MFARPGHVVGWLSSERAHFVTSFNTSSVASNAALSLVTGKTFKLLELLLLNVQLDICYGRSYKTFCIAKWDEWKNIVSLSPSLSLSLSPFPLSPFLSLFHSLSSASAYVDKMQITMQKNFKDVKDIKYERSAYNMLFLVYFRSLPHNSDADDAINV